ncbi:tannase/feruloyl esterase family alpha/beta hydrolase [Methylocapsa sp. S129]|uniref:tannase/feruloyl esterase family alpha/beta hydrolase n=1 Tax=Methylocapsa sp. S129 TaxID=1641869 RepID=UPI00131DCB6E|nr:tannase/feruloyl esterase family alpha/beta hydrolase [Methylocapsa sp. S129]
MTRIGLFAGAAIGALTALPALAGALSADDVSARAKPIACDQLTTQTLGLSNVKIVSAESAPADKGLPAACVLKGVANDRIGADGRHYALDFEMRLPAPWNGRFLHQVNGGNDGEVVPAIGDPHELNAYGGKPALARGFAVLSSDEGHSGADPANTSFGLGSGAAFGLDPQARDDYGYAGDATLGPIGKAIIAKFYGEPPARSYMFGCSNGGRHAMVAASRMGDQYDGFVAGDPGFNLPRAAIQHAWDVQSFEMVDPDVKKSFSPTDMALISRKVLDACDKLDGVEDGMVGDIKACQKAFHLADLQCSGEKTDQCLSKIQVEALTRAFGGPRNSKGEQLYSDWPFDAGMGGANWRFWKVFSGIPPWNNNPLIATMGAASLAAIFTTPPTMTKGDPDSLMAYLSHFDFDRDAPKIYAKGPSSLDGRTIDYSQSAWAFMTPPDADDPKLSALKAAGHKIILYHGESDGVFSFNASATWIEKLDANNGGDAGSFARLFAVPGMNHCSKGPATDNFDMLSAIVDWAEQGKAPDRIIATVSAGNKEIPVDWSPERTRPLCPWPKVARYIGGDKEKVDSFACR